MLENGLLLIQIIVMSWIIFRTLQHELKAKKRPPESMDIDE